MLGVILLVDREGVEPSRPKAPDPKSGVAAVTPPVLAADCPRTFHPPEGDTCRTVTTPLAFEIQSQVIPHNNVVSKRDILLRRYDEQTATRLANHKPLLLRNPSESTCNRTMPSARRKEPLVGLEPTTHHYEWCALPVELERQMPGCPDPLQRRDSSYRTNRCFLLDVPKLEPSIGFEPIASSLPWKRSTY